MSLSIGFSLTTALFLIFFALSAYLDENQKDAFTLYCLFCTLCAFIWLTMSENCFKLKIIRLLMHDDSLLCKDTKFHKLALIIHILYIYTTLNLVGAWNTLRSHNKCKKNIAKRSIRYYKKNFLTWRSIVWGMHRMEAWLHSHMLDNYLIINSFNRPTKYQRPRQWQRIKLSHWSRRPKVLQAWARNKKNNLNRGDISNQMSKQRGQLW